MDPNVPAASITLRATRRNGPPCRARRLALVWTTSSSHPSDPPPCASRRCAAARGAAPSLQCRCRRQPARPCGADSRRASPSRRGCIQSRSRRSACTRLSATLAELPRSRVSATVIDASHEMIAVRRHPLQHPELGRHPSGFSRRFATSLPFRHDGAEQLAHVVEAFVPSASDSRGSRRPLRALEHVVAGLRHHAGVDERAAAQTVRDDGADVGADAHVEESLALAARGRPCPRSQKRT